MLPSIARVWTTVLETHASSTTSLEHLEPQVMRSLMVVPVACASPHAVAAIVIHNLVAVNPEFTAIVRLDPEMVRATVFHRQHTSPAHCKVVSHAEAWPIATRAAIPHLWDGARQTRSTTLQVLQLAALTEIESLLFETAARRFARRLHYRCINMLPSVVRVWTMILEFHASSTTSLEHLESQSMGPAVVVPAAMASPHTMATIVVHN
jgi:hypothetical protein